MFKVLNADIRKLRFSKGFMTCIEFISVYLIGYTVLMKIISHFAGGTVCADELVSCFGSMAVLLISACSLLTTISDYDDGCIRNKLISGAGRDAVFLSASVTALLQALILSAVALAETVILSLIFTSGTGGMSIAELADRWLVITLACMAIAVFSTMLIMLLGGNKSAYITGIAVAVCLNIFSLDVMEKLYPESGVCTLTGTKLQIYSFYDRFIPYAYPAYPPHHGMLTYLAGAAGTIALSLIIGLVLFNRKEIQ